MTTDYKLRQHLAKALPVLIAFNTCNGAHAKSTSLTGTYVCKVGRNDSELYIKQLAPNKIQFALKTVWAGRNAIGGDTQTGQSGGIVELKSGIADYSHPIVKFKLHFSFKQNKCTIACTECGGFGGVRVDPNGVYRKENGKTPTKDDLETYQ